MHFLIDENAWITIGHELQGSGFEVTYVRDRLGAASDADIMAVALEEQLVIVTEDKDYGHLIFGLGKRSYGVIQIPFYAYSGDMGLIATGLARHIAAMGTALIGALTVFEPERTRQRRLDLGPGGRKTNTE